MMEVLSEEKGENSVPFGFVQLFLASYTVGTPQLRKIAVTQILLASLAQLFAMDIHLPGLIVILQFVQRLLKSHAPPNRLPVQMERSWNVKGKTAAILHVLGAS